jgi:energy-coupling factor transport system ATP-binding protein
MHAMQRRSPGPPAAGEGALVAIRDLTVEPVASGAGGAGLERAAREATADAAPAAWLTGITLDIAPGEVVGVVGPQGPGRSALLRCLNGVVPHLVDARVAGSIRVAGLDPVAEGVATMSRTVSLVLEDAEAQLSQFTVAEEVALGLENAGVPTPAMREIVAATLQLVGLDGQANRSPLTLSGGEQQRLVLAGAIAVEPRVLVLDDALVSLDPAARRSMLALLRRLASERAMAVIVADQDAAVLAEHADRLLFLAGDTLILDLPPQAFFVQLAGLDEGRSWVPGVAWVALDLEPAAVSVPVTVDEAVPWVRERW